MSYILEALNKSEQERRTNQAPDLNTVHRLPPDTHKEKSSTRWIVFGLVILLLNMAGLWYWLKPKAVVEQVPVQVVTPAVQSTPAPVVATPTPAVTVPDQITASTRQEKPQLITPQDAFRSDPVRISELPLNVQRQIPDMVFSSHLYADEADFRMVNINGRMYRENEMVSDGVKLIEITEQGVVLTYLHYTFEVSVLQDWSFN